MQQIPICIIWKMQIYEKSWSSSNRIQDNGIPSFENILWNINKKLSNQSDIGY